MNQPATSAAALPAAQSTQPFGPGRVLAVTTCPRCGGNGYLSHYYHIERGRCFRCQGTGQLSVMQAA